MATVLHAGCGYAELPGWLKGNDEVRLDVDPECKPDIQASITDLGEIGPYDIVLCQHALEHLYPHEVSTALKEFHRVLIPSGYAAIFVPDLEEAKPTEDVLFVSPAGPITGLDLFYGYRLAISSGMKFMAHHTGFTQSTLADALTIAGFKGITYRLSNYNLLGIGIK